MREQTREHPAIRQAHGEDLAAISDLAAQCVAGMRASGIDQWDERYPSLASFERDVSQSAGMVAFEGQALAAYIAVNEFQDPEYADVPWSIFGRIAVVHRLMVRPSFEGRGLAKHMMMHAESMALSAGYAAMRLDAFAQNPRATTLYAKLGYREVGTVMFRKGAFRCFEKALKSGASRHSGAAEAQGSECRRPLF
jgi:GNAT superfamily N-acetyltransferase